MSYIRLHDGRRLTKNINKKVDGRVEGDHGVGDLDHDHHLFGQTLVHVAVKAVGKLIDCDQVSPKVAKDVEPDNGDGYPGQTPFHVMIVLR